MRNELAGVGLVNLIILASTLGGVARAQPATGEDPAKLLTRGTMAEAAAELSQHLAAKPDDDNARFALGIAQTLRAVEHLAGSMYRYGLRTGENDWMSNIPFFRLPVPSNPTPEPISYDDSRRILLDWLDDLAAARKTLGDIRDPSHVKLRLPVGRMHLDLNGDGRATNEEAVWDLLRALNRNLGAGTSNDFIIALDGGDVHWLLGYGHLLAALGEMVLAYDESELFDATAHLFYAKVETPHAFLNEGVKVADFGVGVDVVDAIAFVHLLNLPVKEPQRLSAARDHLKAMIEQSRKSWALILAETDDELEWVPNPKQSTVLGRLRVTDEMVEGWMQFLDEADAVLDGRKLIPFWRSRDGRGINLRRVFTEPTRFDLVLWFQGTAATPYLEQGELTSPETWGRFQRVFRGEFFTFAAWFN